MSHSPKHAKANTGRKLSRKHLIHIAIVIGFTAIAIGASFISSSIMTHIAVIVPGATEGIRIMVDARFEK